MYLSPFRSSTCGKPAFSSAGSAPRKRSGEYPDSTAASPSFAHMAGRPRSARDASIFARGAVTGGGSLFPFGVIKAPVFFSKLNKNKPAAQTVFRDGGQRDFVPSLAPPLPLSP
jgi:hypothetical protein